MKYRFLQTLLIITVLISAGCYQTTSELALRLKYQLRDGRFDELYDESSDFLHANVSRAEFIRRMKIVATKFKAVDPTLNMERDANLEKGLFGSRDEETVRAAIYRLRKDDQSLTIMIDWDQNGKLWDLSAFPSDGLAEGCRIPGVTYQQTSHEPTLSEPCP